ncbi:MAG: helix-hairpin-helix domain-containing protein [Candidatus Thermoplasmatota archaeon]|nr:helix-hairpin-helix domain-containing protein [Candidatus Thermoplasmatota archaeon]
MKPQWILFLATVSIFVGGIAGVITTDFASMLGAGVLFFAVTFAIAVYLSSRRSKGTHVDPIDDASPVLEEDHSGTAESPEGLQRAGDPLKREKVIVLFMDDINLSREKAENLYDAGYNGWQDFSEAIPEDLLMVKGINPTIARRIISTLRSKDGF